MSDPVLSTEVVATVLKALAKPDYKWRTIAGVAKDTGIATDVVLKVLSATSDQVIKSSIPSADGRDLYTTRKHFREQASLGERLLGVIKNRAV